MTTLADLAEEENVSAAEISRDYHDYVFKEGRLVGDFEGMYRHSAEIPWHQDANSFDIISDIDIAILKRGRHRRICDVGCGLGYFTGRLKRELPGTGGDGPAQVTGTDVSPTAIARAAELFPDCSFRQMDLLAADWRAPEDRFDLVVCRGVLWYVVHDLDLALRRMASLGGEGAHMLVTLSFPPSATWVGQEVLGSAEDLKRHLSQVMDISYWCEERDAKHGSVPLCHAYGAIRSGEIWS
ncbi:class I SAM-dependent methyltransferase [Roseibium aestuarii]|uniref:Class I SAM-dependent methyltransferase n=1 Tax=Roseibium aestuarii TaxID=2600299 RepID=A0ABW4JTL7_9HYPH|nr:class I SAM-dependent methyltransferase [Roseibium aestuarii]